MGTGEDKPCPLDVHARDRRRIEDHPPLRVLALMQANKARGIEGIQSYRVGYKQNAKGEHVVAIIRPTQTP